MKKYSFIIVFLIGLSFTIQAQITVTPNAVTSNAVATMLANKLIGSGVNVSGASLTCPSLASGVFTATSSNLNLDSGIVLTSGLVQTTGPFDKGIDGPAISPYPATNHNAAGDADLTLLCGQNTNDACILEFDFETTGDSVRFNYVFGSSEYNSFTCNLAFNDVFGFFLSGPGIAGPYSNAAINIATVPGSGGTCPVAVSTIYCQDIINAPADACSGPCNPVPPNCVPTSCHASTTGCGMFTIPTATCSYFVCNSFGTTVTYPGFTTVLTAAAQVVPCATYHFKLAIADATDGTFDSGVMLEAGSFSANSVGLDLSSSLSSLSGNPLLIEGCDSICIDVKIEKHGIPSYDTIKFVIQGSALNSIDYNYISDTLIFSPNPNDSIRTICIRAYQDGIVEGTETIAIYLNNFCSTALADSLLIDIIDSLGADFNISNTTSTPPNDSVCLGTGFILTPLIFPIQGLGPLSYNWDFGDGTTTNNAGPISQIHTYTQPGSYSITLVVSDTAGCVDSAVRLVFVDVPPYVELSATPIDICSGERIQFYDSIAPNTFNWIYDFDDGIVLSGLHNPTHVFEKPGTYNVTLTGQYLICPDMSKSVSINVKEFPLINLGDDISYCPGLDTSVTLQNIENPNQILSWSTGETAPSILTKITGRYWASADNNGCNTTDSIWVKRDCYLNIPNSFTPNGDGNNDYFIPRQLLSSGVRGFYMKIMNRWGEIIYVTDKVDGRGWDGKFGEKEQSVGVYIYQITALWKNGYQNSFSGNVTLMR